MKEETFSEALDTLITYKLQNNFVNKVLNGDILKQIHATIKQTVFDVFKKCNFSLLELSKLYIAQEYFKMLNINGDDTFMELIMLNEVKITDLPSNDLRLLANLFQDSILLHDIQDELYKRP